MSSSGRIYKPSRGTVERLRREAARLDRIAKHSGAKEKRVLALKARWLSALVSDLG